MWEDSEAESAELRLSARKSDALAALFDDLMQEVKHAAPGARLSARLRTSLERLSPEARRELCSRQRDGCAPLFVACRRGNLEAVEYLVHVCNADLEQRGVYEVPDERSVHCVTALWCAAVAGHLGVLRLLADAGAALDAGSDSGSTPVRSACFMTHLDVVRFLVGRGADIHRPNHNGGTCLINSVQSLKLCAFLIDHGAEVDARDMQHKTALHYAIQEHRLETVRLLLARGADPALRSRAGDDALRTAAVKGAAQVLALLLSRGSYPPQQLTDAVELLGATQLDEFNDVSACLAAWRRATAVRHAGPRYLEKTPVMPPRAALGRAREWRTLSELEAAAGDADALRTQALLVCARVLGHAHKEHVFRLMYRGAAYAESFRYQRCIELWSWALEIRLEKDSILYADTCHTACALTRLLLDALPALPAPPHAAVVHVIELLAASLPEAREALRVLPVFKKQADTFDRALRCLVHLLLLLQDTAGEGEGGREAAGRLTRRVVRLGLASAHTGDTLLHLAASRLTVIRSSYCGGAGGAGGVFPSARLARALLAGGADALARNAARCSALHVAALPYNYSPELVGALLAGGAHLDQPNRFGDSARELLALHRGARVAPLQHVTLACLAARAWLRGPLGDLPLPPHALPTHLHAFLDLHRP